MAMAVSSQRAETVGGCAGLGCGLLRGMGVCGLSPW
jgi:hypothetical protein